MVERLVANEKVEGSTPFARSIYFMTDLTQKKCIPCEGGAIPFDISEIHKYQKKVDGWELVNDKDIIKFANDTNTVLVFSKTRHFRH